MMNIIELLYQKVCSTKLLRENYNITRPNYLRDNVLQRILVASVNNVVTFSAYINDQNIFFEMTIFETDSMQCHGALYALSCKIYLNCKNNHFTFGMQA